MKKYGLPRILHFFHAARCFPAGPEYPTIGMLVSVPASKFQRDAIFANQSEFLISI